MLPTNPPNPPNQDQNLVTAKNYEKQAKYEDKVASIIQVILHFLTRFFSILIPLKRQTSVNFPLIKLFLLIIGMAIG